MKKILVILGGGRPKGNTRQLVDAFARGATDAGHEVEIISLNKVQVDGCLGCNACRYGKPCIQKDGFNELVPKIKEADCVVFASPLLFWTISSKLKAFVERFYCIAEEDVLRWRDGNGLDFIACACKFTENSASETTFSARKRVKELIAELKKEIPSVEDNIFQSIHNVQLDTLVRYKTEGAEVSFLRNFTE